MSDDLIGYAPVALDALALCGSPAERLCVLALYEQAWSYRYAPMRITLRTFAGWGGLRQESALRLLGEMAEAGLLTRTTGARAETARITVARPGGARLPPSRGARPGASGGATEDKGNPVNDHAPEQSPEQAAEQGSPPPVEQLARENLTRAPERRGEEKRKQQIPPQEKKRDADSSISLRANHDNPGPEPKTPRPTADPLDVATLIALQQDDEPQHGIADQRDHSAVRRALLRGVTRDQLATLWAWSGASSDTEAAACRRGGWRRWGTLLRSDAHTTSRLAAAARWDAAGRPVDQPRTRAPPKGRSILTILQEQEAEEAAETRARG